ncbi:threonine aldolase family protein [Thalassoglobus polymorphus]|uniref:L-allo-threonine aldolase n=1 Tax=Thalassoglobus polymorphus TaxID=2527994 RepID=A0A517QUV4_9PLAN|nr:GntG family PLP-dependent aldolase [Thalassoglobus polymorphus]QDT35367.1 L-allo-threonine aldolase [Thalassoglobus polymorphus]
MLVELRSDTFTKPTLAMREAMMSAEVGDDMVGEDPTVNRLEAHVAEMFGKEAAVYACSATQANQMAIWANCERGDELLIETTGHIGIYESGAPAVISGVTTRCIPGECGRLDVEHLQGQIRRGDDHYATTTLLCLENSTNIAGGRTYSLTQLQRVCNWAHTNDLRTHLDGARIFNACAVRGYSVADIAKQFDTVSVCFSKGLGCPMGAILVGDQKTIARARRARKLMGGALRQAGILAASGLYALDNHVDRLAEDHQNAKRLAAGLAEIPNVNIDLDAVETNLVYFEVNPEWGTAADLEKRAAENGVKLFSVGGSQRLRACTHLDINEDHVDRAIQVFRECLESVR